MTTVTMTMATSSRQKVYNRSILYVFGIVLSLVIGFGAARFIKSVPIAILTGAGVVLLGMFVFLPDFDWPLAMKIINPICGAAGGASRLLLHWDETERVP